MFFKPNLALNSHTGTKYDCYSDWHKEAFGCRPGARQSLGYDLMSVEERQVEHATVDAWFAEDERIQQMAYEVARFRFSRGIEYRRRREGISELAAFEQTLVEHCGMDHHGSNRYTLEELTRDWDHACYLLGLPYSDAKLLKEEWERLKRS